MRRLWYDRRAVAAVAVQFFTQSLGEHSSGIQGTNMVKGYQLPVLLHLERLAVSLAPMGAMNQLQKVINDFILEFQQAGEPKCYLPLAECLAYDLTELCENTSNATTGHNCSPRGGFPLARDISPNSDIVCFIRSSAAPAPALGTVTILLEGEE